MNHKRSTTSSPFKIRIVHLVYSFDTGGMEKGVATLVTSASSEFEHVILCLTTSGKSESLLPLNTQVIELHKPPGNSPLFLLKLSRDLKSLGPDIVHTRNWSGMDGIIAARMAGIRVVVHGEHGWGMKDPEGLHPKRIFIRRFLSRWVREYTCVSKKIENWLCNDVRVGKPVTQIYNGVDAEKYCPGNDRDGIRTELGLAPDIPLVGVVGRLDPIKDHPTLFRAFEAVRTVLPEACLLVVGDGSERERLENQAGAGVIFLGNRSDVPEILRTLDLFILPSLNEGISNTILEAMATGIPVVATRVGGNPELVEDECTGILVKPGDFQSMASAILRYLQHPDLRARHGETGRQVVLKRFSIEAMARSYEAVYRRVACAFPIILFFLLLQVCPFSHVQASMTPFRASPDQVLVLYNADWQKDVDGSEPGQDSREVAEYYVRMHTDSISGKKPYLLGLKCVHREKHLNQWVIREKSQDNKDGIVFVGKGRGPKTGEWARDSRHVEIVIDPGKELIDWDSVEILCRSDQSGEKKPVSPEVTAIPEKKGRKFIYPEIQENKGRCYRFDAHELFKGTVWVIFKAKNRSGKLVRNLKLKYYDRDDFRFSLRGKDGIVDEKHFQEDVAIPVKRFLEDPDNALPDGTLLKDHILYIVICHGLPFSCEGVLGIERGVTPSPGNHGDLGSLEQRLQTLFYDWGRKIVPPVISMYMSGGPDSDKGVRNYRITTAMRYPMVGRRWNPYMHPDTYSFLGKKKNAQFINIPPFPEARKKISPFLFAYGVSRIDGQGPREAKRIIDYSLYASKFLRPEMDSSVRERLKKKNKVKIQDLSDRLKKAEQEHRWGSDEQECLGFRVLSRYGWEGIPFGGRPLEDIDGSASDSENTQNKYMGYYPGGMNRTVCSSNGWNISRSAPIWRQVDQGVTISACGGPAYGGGPHITNATFWDNRILLRYLFRGRDLGECFLLSTYYVNWSTSLLGDPLLHPDLSKTVLDETPPTVVAKESIRIALEPAMGNFAGTMTIPVISTKINPEVARLTVFYSKEGENTEQASHWPIYSTQPYVILRNLEPEAVYIYRPVLTDPYGNNTNLTEIFGRLSFRTDPVSDRKVLVRKAKKRNKGWEIDLLRLHKLSKHGTIKVEFIAGEDGLMPSIVSENLNLKIGNSMQIGGPPQKWHLKSPLQKGEKATLILRWRRFPLTREALLQAEDGTELTLAADVRTPWEERKLRGSIMITEQNQVEILSARIWDDSLPASSVACGITVPPIEEAVWRNANE